MTLRPTPPKLPNRNNEPLKPRDWMPLVLIAIIILWCCLSSGCAVYTVTSVGSLAATGKSLTDHASSQLSGGNCDAIRAVKNISYWCEMPVVYNQNGF